MASVVINTRFNNHKAEADLKELQAKAKDTARDINALEKSIGSATTKRNKLRDDLEAARQKAAETAVALEKVNAQIDAAERAHLQNIKESYPGISNATEQDILKSRMQGESELTGQQQQLITTLNEQNAAADKIALAFQNQSGIVDGLQQQHAALTAQLEREQQAVQGQQTEIADAARVQQAANAVGNFAARITKAVAQAGVLKKTLNTVGTLGQKAFSLVGSRVQAIRDRLEQAAKSAAQFRNRIARLVSGALVFNVLSSGLRTLTSWMGTALLSSSSLRAALGNLQGAAATAAAPIIQILTPALTALANAAAMVFGYIARLVAFFTGKTVSASAGAAKAMKGVGSAAGSAAKKVKDANGELAAFDELNVLNKKSDDDSSGSGGSGAESIVPNYDFTADNPFLDSILDAVEQGEWYKVGQLIGEKLRDSLNAIPWPDIQAKAVQWASDLATMLNGAVETPGLWAAIGHTFAQGLNTVLMAYDTFMQTFSWNSLGAGLAAGLTQAIAEIRWDTLGRALTDGLRAIVLTLYNFTMTFSGWKELGNAIATCLNSAINNIPWQEAAVGMTKLVVGLLNAAITAVQDTDWTILGQNIVEMIGSIDWVGLFAALSTLAVEVLTAINAILGQVSWADVGRRVVECLQAIDWGGILTQVGEFISNSWPVLLAALGASLLPLIGAFITGTVLPAVLSGLGTLIVAIISAIGAWPVLLLAVLTSLAAVVIHYLATHWEDIKHRFSQTLDNLAQVLSTAGENLQQIWNEVWSALGDTVSSILEGITATVKGAVNGIISIINGMIAAIVGGINAVGGLLNSFSFDVPEFAQSALGTSKIGFNIDPITAPKIPYLAQGAVIPANHEFLAVLGDQHSGTNVEAPLETIQQALAEVLAAQPAQETVIRFTGSLAQLARVLKPYIDKEDNRQGARLITGGVY